MKNKIAEEATGMVQVGKLGSLFDRRGIEMPIEEARAVIRMGETIEVPNAGAASYQEVSKILGFLKIKVINWSSSAGDWQFGVLDDNSLWWILYQENRYPYHGFKYGLSNAASDSFEGLLEMEY